MNPLLAKVLLQVTFEPKKLVQIVIGVIVAFAVLFMFVFAVPITMFKTVPLASSQHYGMYVSSAEKIKADTGVEVNWQQVLAIDAVLFNQDFSKANPDHIAEIANRFVKKVITEEDQTTTDANGIVHHQKVKVTHYYPVSFDDVLKGLVQDGLLKGSQIDDVKKYLTVDLTSMMSEGANGGVPLPPAQITDDIKQAIDIVSKTTPNVDQSWLNGMQILVMHESSGDPHSKSSVPVWYSLQWGFQEAEGLCQMMPPTFDEWKLPGHDDIYNPVDNLVASLRYIQSKYGNVYNISGVEIGDYHGY